MLLRVPSLFLGLVAVVPRCAVVRGQSFDIIDQNGASITATLTGVFPSGDTGNAIALDDSSGIELTGEVRKVFSLEGDGDGDEFIQVNKFTRMKFNLVAEEAAAAKGICLYHQGNEEDFEDLKVKCFMIKGGEENVALPPNVEKITGDLTFTGESRENLALGKAAVQSSTYNRGDASKAVDGDTTPEFDFSDLERNTVTYTKSELSPYWEVDLGADFVMDEVVIYKRMDGYNGRLYDFNLIVHDSNDIETFKKTYDTLTTEATIAVDTGGIIGKVVRIQLNDEGVERVLCLAEVMIFGNSFRYDSAIGMLLRMPPTNVNKLALIQKNQGSGTAVSILSSFQFDAGQEEEISSSEWIQKTIGTDDYEINIQGNGFITKSEGESIKDSIQFIAVKDPISQNKILIYTGGSNIVPHEDPFDEVINFAISNEGLMVASFKKNSAAAVRILQVGNGVITKKDELIGGAGYGEGLSITPDGMKVAIGNPNAREVFILSLDSGSIDRNPTALTQITPPNDLDDIADKFGDKIGFSSSGNSIAIAAPSSYGQEGENVMNAGRIYISVFNQRSLKWETNKVILYGLNEGRMLGGGGVAIIDDKATGRIDVKDFPGNSFSFDYQVKCNDPNAIPVGRNENAFDPRCECGENFKSTNMAQGKILRENIDVCVKCEDEEGVGDCVRGADGPTAAPTLPPSTSSPTDVTFSPSAAPSINKDPSASPSNIPSVTLGSLFDGQPCHYDGECKTETCESDVCKPGVLSIATINANGDRVDVDLSLITPVFTSGGAIALNSAIDLNGQVEVTYQLESPISIGKLTFIEANVEDIEGASGLKICPKTKISTEVDCKDLPFNDITSGDAIQLSSTSLLARFITLKQTSGRSRISNIKLVTFQKGLIDEDGNCVDDNAQRDFTQTSRCICKPSFVVWESLNEDKVLNNVLDFCRSCADTDKCSYDGGACEDRKLSCYDNTCESGKCTPQNLSIEGVDGNIVSASFYPAMNDVSSADGGVHVTGSTISLFGNTQQIYELDEVMQVNKYTQLDFVYLHPDEGFVSVSLCFYQSRNDALQFLDDFCLELDSSSSSLKVGEDIFDFRLAPVKYLGFKQTTTSEQAREAEAKLGDIKINQASVMSPLQNNACVDPNAELIGGDECRCKLGYVASNGGRILTDIDACVKCIEPCKYDGDTCVDDWDCYSGKCNGIGICNRNPLQIHTKDIGGQDTFIEANMKLTSSESQHEGGVVIEDTGELIIFGNVTKYYEVSGSISIDRFTMVEIDILKSSEDSSTVPQLSICLYDNLAPLDCPESCREIVITDGKIQFPIDELIAYRDGQLKSAAFRQQGAAGAKVTVKNIKILAKQPETASIQDCGENALAVTVRIGENNEPRCKCSDGFMSTDIMTKNKLLREQDKCVSCIGQSKCYLSGREGEPCANELITDMFLGGLKSEPQRLFAKMVGKYPPDDYQFPLFPSVGRGQGGTFTKTRNSRDNQGEELSYGTIALNGLVSNLFQLQTKYTVDKFSSIFFEASVSSDTDFIAMCFDGDVSVHNSTNILCVNLNGEKEDWDDINYPIISSNIAAGKLATTESSIEPGTIPSYATDGNKTDSSPVFKTLLQDFPWWEVDLEREFEIEQIDIYLEDDESIDTLSDYNVGIYDSTGRLVYDFYGGETEEPVFFRKIVGLPQNTRGSRIRITMNDANRILALKEVEVFERVYSGKRLFEIPIGRIREGMEIEHIAFIQYTENDKSVSNLQNFNFVYGSFAAITSSPSMSLTPTISLSPTLTPTSSPTSSPPTNSTSTQL